MSTAHLLVVDPDAAHRARLGSDLAQHGVPCVAVGSFAEARASGTPLPPMALVDDDAGELCRELRDRGVIVFGMSSCLRGALNHDYAVLRDGVAEWWEKPVAAEDVVRWMRRLRRDSSFGDAAEEAVIDPGPPLAPEPTTGHTSGPIAGPIAGPISGPIAGPAAAPPARPFAAFTPAAQYAAEPVGVLSRPSVLPDPPSRPLIPFPTQLPAERFSADFAAAERAAAHGAEPVTPVFADPEPIVAAGASAQTTAEGPRVPARLDVRFVPDAGDLADVGFPTLLASLAYRRASGALMLHLEDDKRLVYFIDGFAVSARTNREDASSVADVALASGLITPEQHRAAVARGGTTHAGLAAALVEQGALSAGEIDVLASTELRNRILDVFEWEQGAFAFRDGSVPPHFVREPVLSPMDLIWEGVQHVVPLEAIRAVVESDLGSPLVWLNDPPTADDMRLTRSQEAILSALDGETSVHLLSRRGLVNENVQRFVYLLVATGFLAWA